MSLVAEGITRGTLLQRHNLEPPVYLKKGPNDAKDAAELWPMIEKDMVEYRRAITAETWIRYIGEYFMFPSGAPRCVTHFIRAISSRSNT